MPEERAWNPRYLAYAHCHDKEPDEMLVHDTEAWPGGRMAGFILWISAHWERWFIEVKGRKRPGAASKDYPPVLLEEDHTNFTVWLLEQYQRPRPFLIPTETR